MGKGEDKSKGSMPTREPNIPTYLSACMRASKDPNARNHAFVFPPGAGDELTHRVAAPRLTARIRVELCRWMIG